MKSENISAKTAKKRLKDMKKHVSKVLYLILNACSWITLSNHKLIEVAVITIRKISCPDFKVLFNCICQWTQDFYQVAYRNNWEPQRQRLFTATRSGVWAAKALPFCHAWPKGSSISPCFRSSIALCNVHSDFFVIPLVFMRKENTFKKKEDIMFCTL